MTAVSAPQISSWPAASMITHTSATLAPPILSGRWPKNRRAPMKATPNAVKPARHCPILGREQRGDEGGDDAKADAGQGRPMPGAQTALTLIERRAPLAGGAIRAPAATASASMGTNSVATEMPLKPHGPLTTTPAGAQRVGAVHGDAVPGHDLAGVLRPDQADAPAHRAGDDQAFAHGQRDAAGHQDPHRRGRRVKKGQRGQIEQAEAAAATEPATTARLAPRMSA